MHRPVSGHGLPDPADLFRRNAAVYGNVPLADPALLQRVLHCPADLQVNTGSAAFFRPSTSPSFVFFFPYSSAILHIDLHPPSEFFRSSTIRRISGCFIFPGSSHQKSCRTVPGRSLERNRPLIRRKRIRDLSQSWFRAGSDGRPETADLCETVRQRLSG